MSAHYKFSPGFCRLAAILAAFLSTLLHAEAQVATSWLAGNGSWSDGAKWTNGVPNATTADAYIDNQSGTNSIVTLSSAVTVGRLRIDTGDRVELSSASQGLVVSNSSFTGAGELLLNGTLVMPGSVENGGSSQTLDGTKTLNGSGKLQLGMLGRRPEVYGNTTNNATIEGAASFGRYNNSSFFHPIFNAGTVNANVDGDALVFHSFNGTNTGTMKATNRGLLLFAQGNINGTGGQFIADGVGSVVRFGDSQGFEVVGGTLSTLNGGLLETGASATWKDLTSTGETHVGGGPLYLNGTVTNNGVINVNTAGARIETLYNPGFTVTLAGTGEVKLDKPANRNDTAFADQSTSWLIQDQKVHGRGSIGRNSSGSNAIVITNRGTLQADVPNEQLELALGSLDNQSGGTLRAQNNGILSIGSYGPVLNTGGTIEALTGGQIVSTFGRIHGGLVKNNGGFINLDGMVLFNPGLGMTLQGDLTVNNNQTMRLVNAIANEGTLRVRSTTGESTVYLGEDGATTVTLTGNGNIQLGDAVGFTGPANLVEHYSGATLTIADNLIHGFGNFGTGNRQLSIVNQDIVSGDAAARALYLRAANLNNTAGLLRAENGGTLDLFVSNPIANVGALIEAKANSTVQFGGSTGVSGGTLRNANATFNMANGTFDLGNATLTNPGSGLTLQGAMSISNGRDARFIGDITNQGAVRSRSSGSVTRLLIGYGEVPDVHMSGNGDLIVNDSAAGSAEGRIEEGSNNARLFLDDQTLRGHGWVGWSRGLSIINNDLISADVGGQFLGLYVNNLLNSPGKVMQAINGGTLLIDPVLLTNQGATLLAKTTSKVSLGYNGHEPTVSGGIIQSDIGGTLGLENGLVAQGGIFFANAGTTIVGSPIAEKTFNGLNNGGSSFVNSGTIQKTSNQVYNLETALNHTGMIHTQTNLLRLRGTGTFGNGKSVTDSGAELRLNGAYTFMGNENSLGGGGTTWVEGGGSIILADPATEIAATNLGFYPFAASTITGPGTLKISGRLAWEGYTNGSTVSGTKLLNLSGASGVSHLEGGTAFFNNGAQFDNQGTFLFEGYGNTFSGDSGTLLSNSTAGSILRSTSNNFIAMPTSNSGLIEVAAASFRLLRKSDWLDGKAAITTGAELWIQDAPLTMDGPANVVTGGFLQVVGAASLSVPATAKLNIDRLQFNNSSSAAGTGEVNVAEQINFHPYYSPPAVISGLHINLGASADGLIQFDGGTLRFQDGAHLFNAGQINITASSLVEFNTGAIFENNGLVNVFNNPTITGDGTGLLKTLYESEMRFYASRTVNLPFDFAGELYAENGTTVTFDKGGLFNRTAKIWPNNPASNVTFTGATLYRAIGQAIEFPGTGYVNFVDTTLQFEADPLEPTLISDIDAGARVAFHGNNTVKGPGVLSSTGLVFQSGNQTIDGSTLQTTAGDTSVWNATNGKLELKNGAKFRNTGLFVIQARVGNLVGDPGIFGSDGTLFHNTSTGRLIHDTNYQTDFGVDFQNDGVLEFRSGTFNFLKKFTGLGGIAASNGAKVNLSLAATSIDQLPSLLQTLGAGSEINVTLPNAQNVTMRLDLNGGRIVAAGAGNLVAAGGLNLVAAGGGNLVAAGGMNLVAAGGGNITAQGIGTLLQSQNLILRDGGNLVGNDGAGVAAAAASLTNASASFAGQARLDIAGLINLNSSTAIAKEGASVKGGEILSHNGGTLTADGPNSIAEAAALVGQDGGTLVGQDGGSLVAAGGGNRPNRGSIQAAGDPGTITAGSNGTIRGNGTFVGAGFVQNGGLIQPGKSPGTMTWTGNLTVESGGVLEIEIAGTSAGTQYDVLNVSGAFMMNGSLGVRCLNGFGGNVQPTDVFDVVTAGSLITTTLAGSRVNAAGSYGSFEVQLVNGGHTLRLANFQPGAVTYSNWATRYGLTGANADMMADPNHNGLPNLLEYTLGLDPTVGGGTGITTGIVDESGQKYLTLSYTKPTGPEAPTDVIYASERTASLVVPNWSSSVVDVIPLSTVPGPGSLETITVRSTHPISSTSRDFLRLRVTLTP